MTKTVQYQNELHKFLIWDTAGQERVSPSFIYYVFLRGPDQSCHRTAGSCPLTSLPSFLRARVALISILQRQPFRLHQSRQVRGGEAIQGTEGVCIPLSVFP